MRSLLTALVMLSSSPQPSHEYQLIYVVNKLRSDRDVDVARALVVRAAKHGYTGVVLDAGFDDMPLWPEDIVNRLKRVRSICDENDIDLIPLVGSVSYAGRLLRMDPNLAGAVPIRDAIFEVHDGEARLVPDPLVRVANGSFEVADKNRARSIAFHDKPNEVSFIDRKIAHDGEASLRFEGFTSKNPRHGRLGLSLDVKPFRSYRVTCWVKREAIVPASGFRVHAYNAHSRHLTTLYAPEAKGNDWQKLTGGFNSLDNDKIKLFFGLWNARGGRFWIDDVQVEEVGLANVLRRPGTPVSVISDVDGTAYVEGRDFEPIQDKQLDYKFEHDGPPIRILPTGAIRDGERLRVSFYQSIISKRTQVGLCLSEPKVFELYEDVFTKIDEAISPEYYFLHINEWRHGGWCEACTSRGIEAAEILGVATSRLVQSIRALRKDAGIFVWSDMFDPHHNARGNFWMAKGTFDRSWQYLPKDVIIAVWKQKNIQKSLKHFDKLGYETIGCAYYDSDSLDDCEEWLDALASTAGAKGIMYTTWTRDYKWMEQFGDLVSKQTE